MTAPTRTDRRGAPTRRRAGGAARRGRRTIARLAAGVALAGLVAACGKKGPPLAPILYLPAAPTVTALEQGRTARLAFTIPVANTNGARPANLDHLLVYGFTGTPDVTDLDKFFKRATLVARLPVKPAPPPDSDEAENPPPTPLPTAPAVPGFAQGESAVVSETITPALMVPVPPEHEPKPKPKPEATEPPPMAVPLSWAPDTVPVRHYYVVGVTSKGRRGPLSADVSVPLVPPPMAPSQPTVTYTEKAITVTWNPPAFVRAPVQAPVEAASPQPAAVVAPPPTRGPEAAAGRPAAAPGAGLAGPPVLPGTPLWLTYAPLAGLAAVAPPILSGTPFGPTYAASRYNLYEVPKSGAPAPAWLQDVKGDGTMARGPLASPLNGQPLAVTTYTDTRMTWGRQRCYEVRTVDEYGKLLIDSVPSPPTCVTLKDTFPPAAPTGLQGVASAGAISLIWEPNSESDLAGYLVLRAAGPDGTLAPITPTPIHDTTYRDTTVTAGVRYTYVIVAVDTAHNRSAPSNRIEEAAQ